MFIRERIRCFFLQREVMIQVKKLKFPFLVYGQCASNWNQTGKFQSMLT